MATVILPLDVRGADVAAANIPEFVVIAGTNFPAVGYAFDDATTETIYFKVPYLPTYGSGNVSMVLDWYSRTGQTTGTCNWSSAMGAITSGTDAQSYETKAFATATTTGGTTVGGTARMLNRTTITMTNIDSVQTADELIFKVDRIGGTTDTMTGDAIIVGAYLSYSDT